MIVRLLAFSQAGKLTLAAALVAGAAMVASPGCAPPAGDGVQLSPAAGPPGAPTSEVGDGATLEQAWLELIKVHEQQFHLLASVHNADQAERAFQGALDYHRKRHAALSKIAELGGEAPPIGVPAELREQYKLVENRLYARDEVVSRMITPERREQLNQQLQQAIAADPKLQQDPFRLPAAIRTAATKATVMLINNRSLEGPAHQQMIARLRDLAGAQHAQSVIEPDGTYKLVLAPVPDFARLTSSIDFGEVSNRDDAAKTFTLTIDPTRLSAAGGAAALPDAGLPPTPFNGPGGFRGPPPAGRGGAPADPLAQRRALFHSQVGGADRCIELILQGAPEARTPEFAALKEAAKAAGGAGSSMSLNISGQRYLLIGPVEDFSSFVASIRFGTVIAQDPAARQITVQVGTQNPQ